MSLCLTARNLQYCVTKKEVNEKIEGGACALDSGIAGGETIRYDTPSSSLLPTAPSQTLEWSPTFNSTSVAQANTTTGGEDESNFNGFETLPTLQVFL